MYHNFTTHATLHNPYQDMRLNVWTYQSIFSTFTRRQDITQTVLPLLPLSNQTNTNPNPHGKPNPNHAHFIDPTKRLFRIYKTNFSRRCVAGFVGVDVKTSLMLKIDWYAPTLSRLNLSSQSYGQEYRIFNTGV